VVYLPTGSYKITAPSGPTNGSPLVVPSGIILRGDGSTSSVICMNDPNAATETDNIATWGGIDFQGASLSGMTDLGVYAVNPSTNACTLLWNRGSVYTARVSELFFNNLNVQLANCKYFWFESADKILVQNTQFNSNSTQSGPIYLSNDSQLSFLNNTVNYNFGRVEMLNDTNLLMQGNTVTRNAQNSDLQNGTAIESGGVELSFGQNIQVLNNIFQTLNAPSDESYDGEAIATQQSITPNVLDAGSATATTSTTLTDTNALWGSVTTSRLAQYPGEVVAIYTGSATGEWNTIQSINTTTKTITFTQPWTTVPAAGSLYSIFQWTLMNATIQDNTLIDNPNGIVLWDGCYNCTVQNNTLTNSRGIILRTIDQLLAQYGNLYPEGRRQHDMAISNIISNNTVSNTLGLRPAFIVLDTEAFATDSYSGMGMMNIQMGGNILNPYAANPGQSYNPALNEIYQDGIFPCFMFGPAPVKSPLTTVFQNINFWNNSQSAAVPYNSYFASYAAPKTCVTPTAP
jgi:parallel beta-helix repeat protein